MYYAVKYCGDFGFIKQFGGLRESVLFSMVALTPSKIMGIETKIFGDFKGRIIRYRLNFNNIQKTEETTVPLNTKGKTSFIPKHVLINPELYLLVTKTEDVEIMEDETIRLSRNEDILLPTDVVELNNILEFDNGEIFPGFELFTCSEEHPMGNWYGLNKYTNEEQYCYLEIFGKPTTML